ncbi:hypothetical protein A2239_01245 [Candidatus Uhrbacteria bacterium RIFOXYA2_FULL_40_9]|nr:MAG: hypothetical protein A2239_01245 [Candidatus Uhrbacteria bacterium RIFOXYA2_FULL_40_9]OGL97655.1 MAG: hypothetical protein A2332_00695 [Candidatus Uhrbacteria bacterium RIFOXYB2_FULL_41_18]HBK34645.1 hypothetical protein [Candidatus Uhrbacteria bacterium]HCB55650.1 hypothetical protein [Candidatus Uhrbacteria bacterium]
MRPGLRHSLETYGKIIKRQDESETNEAPVQPEQKTESPDEELVKLQHTAEFHMEERAKAIQGKPEAQKTVFAFQQEKQKIMRELHATLQTIDHPETAAFHRTEGSRLVIYDQERKVYLVGEEGKTLQETTLGAIITDLDWGLRYDLDPETVPRCTRKQFAIDAAKHHLMNLLDRQIIQDEMSRKGEKHGGVGTLTPLEERDLSHELSAVGWLAELMAHNFLKKLSLDGDIPIRVSKADCYDDVANKIDFYIDRVDHRRGAQVDEEKEEEKAHFGIQFTLQKSVGKKREQLAKIRKRIQKDRIADDIVLVKVPVSLHVSAAMRLWEERGKPSGGPEQFWPREVKEKMFRGLLQQMFSVEEIDKLWEAIANQPSLQENTHDQDDLKQHLENIVQERKKTETNMEKESDEIGSLLNKEGPLSKQERIQLGEELLAEWKQELKQQFPNFQNGKEWVMTVVASIINSPEIKGLSKEAKRQAIKETVLRSIRRRVEKQKRKAGL